MTGVGFEDVASRAGIAFQTQFLPNEQGEPFKVNLYDHGSGVAVGDYDGDGRDDLYFCNQLGPNALYHNDGNGRFSDVTSSVGNVALADRISVSGTFADYDNDGHEDLYVTTTRGGNVLLRNRGDGRFEDVTEKAGLSLVAHSQTAAFFDADGDGFLDILVTNTARWTTESYDATTKYFVGPENMIEDLVKTPPERNRYYHNRRDGTFEDATASSGLTGTGWGGDTAVFDHDDDGDLDVFVGCMFGRSTLFSNDGKGHFRDATPRALGRTSFGTMGARAFDYDGDGRLDLFLVDMHSDMWTWPSFEATNRPERARFGSPWGPTFKGTPREEAAAVERMGRDIHQSMDVVFGNTLFRNLGGGRFQETSERAGVETFWPWGIAAGDFDGDGFEDAYVPSGMGHPFVYWRSPLFMNNGNGTFADRSREAGLDPMPGGSHRSTKVGGRDAARSSRCAATADFDGDGRLDLVVNNFNDVPFLLMNRWVPRNYVALRLTGVVSNRDAIGALVRLHVGGRVLVRQVQAVGGYLAQSSNALHFGLGDAKKIDACEIRWPSGRVQTLAGLRINRMNEVREPTD
jgi:hypothetical protein